MPTVSVVIPTYNREQLVTLTIDSILRQTYKDFEVIVVDDGSTDSTPKVLESYGDKIRVIRQDNTGVSGAINAGIKAAQGEWIGIVGSDDELMPEYLAWQIDRVRLYPDVICHITNSVTILPNKVEEDHFQGTGIAAVYKKKDACVILERPLYTIIKHSPWFVQAAIMRKEVLLSSGLFDPSLTIGEDLDVVARMSLMGPFSICNKQLVCIYRREEKVDHLSKIVVKEGLYSCESLARVYTQLRMTDNLLPREQQILDQALSANSRALANILLRNGRTKEARTTYKKAMLLHFSTKSVVKYLLSYLPAALAVRLIRKGRDVQIGGKKL